MKKITLVIPVFNEEQAIPFFYEKVRSYAPLSAYEINILFVNDGSKDNSESLIRKLIHKDSLVSLLNLSRNFGKEAALVAGLDHAKGDAVIPMDVDLQDPIEVVPSLLAKWEEGFEVVLAKRENRNEDSYLKRKMASLFYRFYNRISALKMEENVGDFRVLSSRALGAVRSMKERNLFMKGMLSWIGFKTAYVEYTRAPRVAGSTKFNGWKLWNLAVEGITSFSVAPLKIWTYLGAIVALFSLGYGVTLAVDTLFWGNPVPGYPSLMVAILFFGGVQLIGIGVLGEYLGRVYLETKRRPRYLIEDFVEGDKK